MLPCIIPIKLPKNKINGNITWIGGKKTHFRGIKTRIMKKYLSFLLGLMLIFILTSCSSVAENIPTTVSPQQVKNTTSVRNDNKV